jgi:Flp pilus assembly protein TadG
VNPKLQTRLRCEKGQSATEFALVLPALALVLFAIIQFGIVFHDYITLTDAVRAGSRKAAVSRLDPNREQLTRDAVKDAAPRLTIPNAQISVVSSWEPGEPVTVTVTHPYAIKILGKQIAEGDLSSSIKERVE